MGLDSLTLYAATKIASNQPVEHRQQVSLRTATGFNISGAASVSDSKLRERPQSTSSIF